MSFLITLWLPIVLSAVIVFVASSIIHMLLGYHASDFKKLADENGVMDAFRKFNIPPGDYLFPCAKSGKEMKSPEFVEKYKKGPVVMMTVMPPNANRMGTSLTLWFIYCLVVSVFAAYIGIHAAPPGTHYLAVFRFVGCSAFMAYALAVLPASIWYHRNWGTTLRSVLDGLIYGLLTAGTFGWLWPKM
jgi:hypothetical protein